MIPRTPLRRLIQRLWTATGWSFVGDPPKEDVAILVGAPHTSNWDYLAMLAIAGHAGLPVKFLGKHTLFKGPLGYLSRATGGIPVDRENPSTVVSEIVERIQAGERFLLVIAPEGTRARGAFWKSGFYRIAETAGIPLVLGFIDKPTKTGGLGPTIHPSDISQDMERIREFYEDKHGIVPRNRTEPRLREES
ncbi:1-acyl-sn-glycerol-3-phosphate acyltransferase [Saxibacter everestensis]|uniref:1-acyl-sn-glycerol-3-phosphate acyltransferase n=1 Tax=Saxibacter everestensis TaxID=2909229 RepID=A0ABY8QQA8_9MICO|nr:1-acyl-sn-glycerol-3-phosphate acyltransferase [Brevibacteriaceae bacterium ZFBP1038]